MKNKMIVIFKIFFPSVAMAIILSFLPASTFAYWVGEVNTGRGYANIIEIGEWGRIVDPPPVMPGLTYGQYCLVRDGLSVYYREVDFPTTIPPTENGTGWVNVPNYYDAIGISPWDPDMPNHYNHIGEYGGMVIEYEGELYERFNGYATGAPPPDEPGAWRHVLRWEDTKTPVVWTGGRHLRGDIFYLDNGVNGSRVYYVMVQNETWEQNPDVPNPNAETNYYRRIPNYDDNPSAVFSNFATVPPWGNTNLYHCYTVDEDNSLRFWKFENATAPNTISGIRPGTGNYWVEVEFYCTRNIIAVENSIWTRANTTPIDIDPGDDPDNNPLWTAIWTKHVTVPSGLKYVYLVSGNEVKIYQKITQAATGVLPGTDPTIWRECPTTLPY